MSTELRTIGIEYRHGVVDIEMPRGAKILSVRQPIDPLMVDVLVDTGAPDVTRRLFVYGTRRDVPDAVWGYEHVATITTRLGGVFVVFDAGEVVP